ncbi:MAG TPA: iron ABC transporter permease [Casimicrobiaceae bacterium]|nr:iron ABC transporter permease [Casimicrobiaceae bacterium]
MRTRAGALTAAAVALAAVAALPVVAIVARGIAPEGGATWTHLASTVLPDYLANTLLLVVAVGLGAGIGGTATAWLVAQRRFPGSRVFEWALLLPLAMPAYVMAYAYTDFLQYAGPVQSLLRESFGWSRGDYWFPDVRTVGGAAVMFVFTLYPYVYLLARTAFVERSPALVEAARTLGLNRRQAFWRIEFPLARPAVAGGVALALMETLADYGTVAYFAVDTFTTGIYRAWFSLGDHTAAAQLAASLLGFVLLALALERFSRRAARVTSSPRGRTTSSAAKPRLSGAQGAAAWLACAIPLAVGFAIPLLLLVRLIVADPETVDLARFGGWAWNSMRVAGIAAVVCVALSILVAYAGRISPGPLTRASSRLLALGYAVPGTVLAVGVMLPVSALDRALADAWRASTGTSAGLLLTGTVFALVYAYVVRYFAVAWNGIEPGFARITPAMDAAARILGAGTVETLLRVHAPLLARSSAAAALLVFVDVMKELPATLLMRPFNFDTLATQAYQLARDERLAEAALPSLAIVVAGLAPIMFLARAALRVQASPDGKMREPHGAARAPESGEAA